MVLDFLNKKKNSLKNNSFSETTVVSWIMSFLHKFTLHTKNILNLYSWQNPTWFTDLSFIDHSEFIRYICQLLHKNTISTYLLSVSRFFFYLFSSINIRLYLLYEIRFSIVSIFNKLTYIHDTKHEDIASVAINTSTKWRKERNMKKKKKRSKSFNIVLLRL